MIASYAPILTVNANTSSVEYYDEVCYGNWLIKTCGGNVG